MLQKILLFICSGQFIAILILSICLSVTASNLKLERIKANQTTQTVRQLEAEISGQREINQQQEKHLQALKGCQTLKDYIKVWDQINQDLQQ